MKILLIGATGTIGSKVYAELAQRHEVVRASANNSEVKVDINDKNSIKKMFEEVGKVDAVILTAGGAHFGPLKDMQEEDFYKGIRGKLMGQVNTVLVGKDYVNDQGSFTLTSGILSEDPILNAANISGVNGGVDSFVKAAAVELERGIRINVVSPGLVEDSVDKMGKAFPGHDPVSMRRVVLGYEKSVEGANTGQVIRVF